MMNIAWKIGVKIQARKLTGSAPGWAGSSGGIGVAVGAGPEPLGDGAPVPAQAATNRATRASRRNGAARRSMGRQSVSTGCTTR